MHDLSPRVEPNDMGQDDQEWKLCFIEYGSRASIYTPRSRRQLRLIYDVFG